MDITVTEFKHRCLQIVRRVETTGRPVTIRRRGKAVAQLEPASARASATAQPWQKLRALGGSLRGPPGDSVISDTEFEALR